MNVVSLGGAACSIARKLSSYSQYNVLYIDTQSSSGTGKNILLKEQFSHEDYEKNFSPLKFKLKDEDTLFITCGAGNISGAALKILQQIDKKLNNGQISLLYIKPDEDSLGTQAKLKHRLTFQVLQQYARSNVLDRLYIVDNAMVEKITGELSIKDYWDNLNDAIASTYHMINIFNNTEPLLSTFTSSPPPGAAKICTFGLLDPGLKEEKVFYDLKYPRTKMYYFAISSSSLDSDKDLLHRIRKFVRQGNSENINVAFSIYSTDYDDNYVYSVQYASYIQEEKSLNL